MAAISMLNPKAEVARAGQTLAVNIGGAKGIQDVLKTNLGPKGTMKMLVGGAGDIKITKDGNVLLHEMQIQHPTASLIARASTAQDDITGDGTTSTLLIIGEFLKQADLYISEGLHPSFYIGKPWVYLRCNGILNFKYESRVNLFIFILNAPLKLFNLEHSFLVWIDFTNVQPPCSNILVTLFYQKLLIINKLIILCLD